MKREEKNSKKISYNHWKEIDKRGFNIVTNDDKKTEYKSGMKSKDINNDWKNLCNLSGSIYSFIYIDN